MNIKVLIVDNEPTYLDATARFLEVHNYDVYRAVSLEQARLLFDYTWVHIALIDVRMRDDSDRNDTSGLLLAKDSRYRSVPKIMLTQHPSYEYVREALGPDSEGIVPAVYFHNKQEELGELIRVLKQTFEQRVRLNPELTITWNQPLTFPYLVNLIQPEQDNERLLDRAGELEDLFRKLFYDSAQITIGRVLKHGAGWLLLEVFAYGDAGNERQFVVSCGIKEQIAEESQRYDKVAPQGTGVGSTVKQRPAETLRFAAIPYILIGGDLEEMVSFRDYYQRRSADVVVASMRHLYSVTLPAWYQSGREQQYGASLSELYARGLGLTKEHLATDALRERVKAIAHRMLAAGLVGGIDIAADEITIRFANGATLAWANPIAERYDERIDPGVPILYGVIHGSVDPDSILVNGTGQTWLIDFTRAGQGLLLQDFIAMETAMKVELIETLDLQMRYSLEQRLLETTRLSDTSLGEGLPAELQPMVLAIAQIRASAAELAGEQFRSYLVGMFFCALRYVATFDPTLQYTRRRLVLHAHGLLLAAMLYNVLNQPLEQPRKQPLSPLRIDIRNESAWLGDTQLELTPREYQLLKYLYERNGQLCTRQAITDHLLASGYEMTDESWLNSLVNRLRSKIEPDPDHSHYLLTVRGRGYRLMLMSRSREDIHTWKSIRLAQEFFKTAYFQVELIQADTLGVKSSRTGSWIDFGSILVRCFEEDTISSAHFQQVGHDAQRLGRSTQIAFVIHSGEIATEATLELWRAKQAGFIIVPLHAQAIKQSLFVNDSDACYRQIRATRDTWSLMSDPYEGVDSVTDPQWFVGRSELISDIMENSSRGSEKQIVLWGMRRVGKTATLNRLETAFRNKGYPVVKWLYQRESAQTIFHNIISDFQKSIEKLYPSSTSVVPGTWEEYQKNGPAQFQIDIIKLWKAVKLLVNDDVKFILLLDELEIGTFFPGKESSEEDYERYYSFSQTIKGVFESVDGREALSIVIATEYPWVDEINIFPYNNKYQNPLFKRFILKPISFMNSAECYEMIEKIGGLAGLQFETQALQHIYNETNGHPQVTRWLCSCIFLMHYADKPRKMITVRDVDRAIDFFLKQPDGESYRGYFEHVFWNNPLSSDLENDKIVLSELVTREMYPINDLIPRLLVVTDHATDEEKRRIAIEQSINRLKELSIIQQDEQLSVYRITIPLYTKWIQIWKLETILIFQGVHDVRL